MVLTLEEYHKKTPAAKGKVSRADLQKLLDEQVTDGNNDVGSIRGIIREELEIKNKELDKTFERKYFHQIHSEAELFVDLT